MKCQNCSSPMFVAEQNETPKSLVKFFKCTICTGEQVSSEPLNYSASDQNQSKLFASSLPMQQKRMQMV